MSDLHELTAEEQCAALRNGDISSRDLTEHYLARIDRLDTHLGAFTTVTPEVALDEAARADARIARGEWSALLGVPIGFKDMYATAGIRTTLGSASLDDHVPTDDSWTVRLLRRSGAVALGKTSTPEFGATCYTENATTPRPAVTPYRPTHYSSGSSGGAATAVSAGLLPFAHGSDSAGSIRTPAATCHLVGFKPSRGLVSAAPASSFFNAGTEGPLARTVADTALLLEVMAKPWPGDLYGWSPSTSLRDAVRRDPDRRMRIAFWTSTGLGSDEPHPHSIRAVQRTASLLRALGHDVREIELPARCDGPVEKAMQSWFASAVASAVPAVVPNGRVGMLRPYTRHLEAAGNAMSANDLVAAQSVLARYASTFLASLEGFDAAVTPTTNGPPMPIGHYTADGVEGIARRMLEWSCYTPWVNLTGQPAISLPSHVDADGSPCGVQLVGRQRHDAGLLGLASQLETAGLWDDVHPSCWNQ